jgi:hypothetical protein
MRELLSIRQSSDVLEYASRFEQAKHRVLVHNNQIREVFFVQKFLDGLKYGIRKTIALHRPRTVDAALSLALMQEEILEASQRRQFPRNHRSSTRTLDRATSAQYATAAGTSQALGVMGVAPVEVPGHHKAQRDDKLSQLMAQRKKLGLCMKCGKKWGRNHKCRPQVPLHVMEEVWEIIQQEDKSDHSSATESDEELLVISRGATVGVSGKRTMRLQGKINK